MPRTSDKAEQILDYVNQFVQQNGYAPSVREIGAAVGCAPQPLSATICGSCRRRASCRSPVPRAVSGQSSPASARVRSR